MIFTGDFVFVGDIGRPDLLEKAAGITGTQEQGARQMFNSLKRFKALDDFIQVWPGHGAGSACGKALGAVPSSTVGYEKITNWGLNIEDEEVFVKTLLDGQPEPPKYFAEMKKLNKVGPKVLGSVPRPGRLSIQQFEQQVSNGVKIIDTRNKISFSGGHFPNSINIQDNSAFSTWAGWILNYDNPFLLITRDDRIEDLTKALIRIGLDNIVGYVNDIDKISNAGYELKTLNQITIHELKENLDDYYVLDVRGYSEHNVSHIPGAINIHAGYLTNNLQKLPAEKQIVVHCASGDRSAIASSVLLCAGFNNVSNLTCGFSGWQQAGYPVERSELVEA
jgi:hydroxyacylglutathione hydrolase